MGGPDRPTPLIEPMSDHPLKFCRDDWDVAWHTQVCPSEQAQHQTWFTCADATQIIKMSTHLSGTHKVCFIGLALGVQIDILL